jgi:lipopolysaccharide export system permease protein
MLSILHRYVLRELAKSFLMSFLALLSVMVLGGIIRPLQMGLTLLDLFRFLPFLIPYLLAWVVPATLLSACIMTYGRLSAENELTACAASGIPLRYMCYPAFLFAIVLTIGAVPLNDWLIPRTRAIREAILRQVFLEKPFRVGMLGGQETLSLGPYKVYVESMEGDRLNNVVVIAPNVEEPRPAVDSGASAAEDAATQKGGPAAQKEKAPRLKDYANEVRVYRAREARYATDEEKHEIIIRLIDAQYTIVAPGRNARQWLTATAEQQEVRIPTDDPDEAPRERRSTTSTTGLLRDASAQRRAIAKAATPELRARLRRQLAQTLTEVHLREALAFAGLSLCFVGVPLGVWMRKESRLASFAAAVLVFALLYAMIAGGKGMANGAKMPPHVALWGPDILMAAVGLGLLLRRFRR